MKGGDIRWAEPNLIEAQLFLHASSAKATAGQMADWFSWKRCSVQTAKQPSLQLTGRAAPRAGGKPRRGPSSR